MGPGRRELAKKHSIVGSPRITCECSSFLSTQCTCGILSTVYSFKVRFWPGLFIQLLIMEPESAGLPCIFQSYTKRRIILSFHDLPDPSNSVSLPPYWEIFYPPLPSCIY